MQETRHTKSECPNIESYKKSKHFKENKKAFMAAWGESNVSESESEEEVLNLCLMTKDNEDEVHNSSIHFFLFDELQDAVDEQHLELKRFFTKDFCLEKNFENLTQENDALNYQVDSLIKDLACVTKQNEKIMHGESNDLKTENCDLKKKVESLTQNLARCTQGRKNLDILLG